MSLLLSLLFACSSPTTNPLDVLTAVSQIDSPQAKKNVEPSSAPFLTQAANLQVETHLNTQGAALAAKETSQPSSNAWCAGKGAGTELRWSIFERESFHRESLDWDAYRKLWEAASKGPSPEKKMVELANAKEAKRLFPKVSTASLRRLDFKRKRYLLYFTTPQVVGESPSIQAVVRDGKQLSVVVAENYSCGGAVVEPIILVRLLELERVELPVFVEMCPRDEAACPPGDKP